MDAAGDPDAGERGVDAAVRRGGDERLLGGWIAALVAAEAGWAHADSPAGDLPGQRAEQRGDADTVPEADDRVRGLVGAGSAAGVLPPVPQQVQSDRAMLVDPGAEVGRGVAQWVEGDLGVRS